MTQKDGSRQAAHKGTIRSAIPLILSDAVLDFEVHADRGLDLRDAPEYLIAVELAQGLTRVFERLRYRLEHGASDYKTKAAKHGTADRTETTSPGARFDIVLLNKTDNLPRYIMEVKRGIKIIDDAKRLIRLSAADHGRRRWNHAFVVSVVRRKMDDAWNVKSVLAEQIRAAGVDIVTGIGKRQTVTVKASSTRIGNSRIEGKDLYALVFQISVKPSKQSNVVSVSGEVETV